MSPSPHVKSRLHSVFQNKSTTHYFNLHTATNLYQNQYFTKTQNGRLSTFLSGLSFPDFFRTVKVKKTF
jgi:hypothetical protein